MSERRELTLCEFNVENLFISLAYYEGQDLEEVSEMDWREFALTQMRKNQKPLSKLWGLSKAIQDINPDILMLVEVGGEESLLHFNRLFLGDRYTACFIEGNSQRGIDLAFLVKKGIGYRVEARSNRDTPVEVCAWNGKYVSRFSRDVAELRLYEGSGEGSGEVSGDEANLRLILLLAHLKSMISKDGDFKGKDVRTAEAAALVGLYSQLRNRHPDVPLVVGGDFNSELSSLELELLRSSDLQDFHDIIGTSPEKRVSLVHFDYLGRPFPMVLDYLLISPQLKDRVVAEKSYTYRYKGFYDIPEDPPKTTGERFKMPSDHYPLVLTLKL